MMRKFILLIIVGVFLNSVVAYGNIIEGVPVLNKNPQLPTGCEITSLTMLLNWYGIDVSKEEIANEIPKGGRGMHPNDAFLGNPFTTKGYGVFEQPILDIINTRVPGCGVNLTGKELEELFPYIDMGFPVQIWCTISMVAPAYRVSWRVADGDIFYWPENEHSVVLVGYDDTSVYINDPIAGKMVSYPIEKVKTRYDQLGKKAVCIDRPILLRNNEYAERNLLEKNGVSYLPLRDICESVALAVNWNEVTNTIEIAAEEVEPILLQNQAFTIAGNLISLEYPLLEEKNSTYISLEDAQKFLALDITKNETTGITEITVLGLSMSTYNMM